MDTLWGRLFAPVDITALVYFRIAFGLLMLWEVWRYFDRGWIRRYYIDPSFHFTYFGFDWVQPWPGNGMYLHFYALGALAVCIALGFWYRLSATLFFLGFTYVFLLDQARYLNHFYLISLISFLLIFVPAHRAFSLDAVLRPNIAARTAPAWTLWLLRAQMGIVYFYGGLAKLNPDWLRGEPMRQWLADRTSFPIIGPLFTQEWAVATFNYGGLLFDLLVVPLLLWPRTRVAALVLAVAFHLTNARLFNIGVFPWLGIAATLLFLPPGWPRRVLRLVWHGGAAPAPAAPQAPSGLTSAQRATLALLGLYMAVQLLVPFRHHLYPGEVSWTEEGHRFSWRMKLRDKDGEARFFATDPTAPRTWEVDLRPYANRLQRDEMNTRPDMILQLAHHIASDLRGKGYAQIQVRALVLASLNGRERQLLINPSIDLAAQPRNVLPAAWIVPLEERVPLSRLSSTPRVEDEEGAE